MHKVHVCIPLHIGVARIFSGITFFPPKVYYLFYLVVVAPRRHSKTTKLNKLQISPRAAKYPKIDNLLCLGVHLQIFPVNYA